MTLAAQDYGQLEVAITPLIDAAGGDVDPDDLLWPDQYADVEVIHPLNDGRTGRVTLSMDDPLTAGLEPWRQALRILYYRPGSAVGEPIFWGQCNVEDDYEKGTVTLSGQDPSIRCKHHYLRIGDDALNDIADEQKGKIHPDWTGIALLVEAAQAASGPVLGLQIFDTGSVEHATKWLEVERAQEIWSVIVDEVVANALGPDIDLEPNWSLGGGTYAFLITYEKLMRDLTALVSFDYGPVVDSLDNAPGVRVSPSHPTTHAHVTSRDRDWRSTVTAPAATGETGMWVDWIATDYDVVGTDTTVLEERGKAHIRSYGRPPKQAEVTLRPDTPQQFFYGHPSWGAFGGDDNGDFYIGDAVAVRAERGYRSIDAPYRIREVRLSQPGWRGAVTTNLAIVPIEDPALVLVVDTDET